MINLKNKQIIWLYPILILFTVIAYWGVQDNEFLGYDDNLYVTDNPHVTEGFTLQNIGWAFTASHASNWHPLTWISHMLDCQLFGTNATWHHLHNLLLHLMNVLLLFELMQRMTGAIWRSAFVALAFALHPMHVESVAWVAERKDVLSTLFGMLLIIAYLRYVKYPTKSRYLLLPVIYIMGLMAKPMLVTLPFVLLLLDYWPLDRMYLKRGRRHEAKSLSLQARPGKLSLRQLIIEKIPLFIISICSCMITYLVQQRTGAMTEFGVTPFSSRFANAVTSYLSYIEKIFVPMNLTVLYPYPADGIALYKPVTASVILILITFYVVRFDRRKPYLFTGWFWYLGTLVPVIGIVKVGVQSMADRYTYIPYVGLFIIVVWLAHDITAGWKKRKIIVGILAATSLGGMIILTRTQVKYWENSITLYEHAFEVTNNNYMMHHAMGVEMEKRNQINDAEHHYRRTIEINPNFGPTYLGLGTVYWRQGKPEKAAEFYRKSLKINPKDPLAKYNLSVVLKSQKDVELYRKILAMNPDDLLATYNLGIVLKAQSKFEEANIHLGKIDLTDISVKFKLARLLYGNHQTAQAIQQFKEILQRERNHIEALNNLAWILAACKEKPYINSVEAVKLAQAAYQLTDNRNMVVLDTLAVAYAANGQFEKAIDTAQKALSLAGDSGQEVLRKQIEVRLALFRQREPYVDQ